MNGWLWMFKTRVGVRSRGIPCLKTPDRTAHRCTLCVAVVYDMGQEAHEESDDHPSAAQTTAGLRAIDDDEDGRGGGEFGFDGRDDATGPKKGGGFMANPTYTAAC